MKNLVTLKQETYTYGRCNCCGKRFNRRVRGFVFGFSNGKYFSPVDATGLDTEKEYRFENVPADIKMVKVGYKCSQPIFKEIEKAEAIKPQIKITPKKATGEFKVWNSDNNDYHYVIVDAKGGEMKLARGSEYLEFKIAQQNYLQIKKK
jgi:hypothetical protein